VPPQTLTDNRSVTWQPSQSLGFGWLEGRRFASVSQMLALFRMRTSHPQDW